MTHCRRNLLSRLSTVIVTSVWRQWRHQSDQRLSDDNISKRTTNTDPDWDLSLGYIEMLLIVFKMMKILVTVMMVASVRCDHHHQQRDHRHGTPPWPGPYWDIPGQFCSSRYPPGSCCPGAHRQDRCHVEVLDTLCYCDQFCNRTISDCCPDYFSHCEALSEHGGDDHDNYVPAEGAPEEMIVPPVHCKHGVLNYRSIKSFWKVCFDFRIFLSDPKCEVGGQHYSAGTTFQYNCNTCTCRVKFIIIVRINIIIIINVTVSSLR